MTDVEDIIEYIKNLKRGFDKDVFKEKIEELSYIVDTIGLDYEEFHTLFKVWLNLCIPVNKWMSVGVCLVPRDRVEARTVDYALRWLLASHQNQTSFSRIALLLDWLTAALNCDSIDMKALDLGYEVFYLLLSYEVLTPHAIKLVYSLSKPVDVSRVRVNQLLDIAKKREEKKSKCRQIQVLLGLFKSYKPECVPESIPAFSIHTAFRKLNVKLLERFARCQAHLNSSHEKKERLLWVNPLDIKGGKKADPLVPNMEFKNVGSKQYEDKETLKNYFDFSEARELVTYSLHHKLCRPARLPALLCNEAGLTLLATATTDTHAFLSHELMHMLTDCFLQSSPYSHIEKAHFLQRLARLQQILMQGVPVVTAFLAQFLPFWNEKDFFHEILDLVEWLSVESPSHVTGVLRPLARIYHRARPIEQGAMLNCFLNLYTNLGFASTRQRQHFMNMEPSANYAALMSSLATYIGDICNKTLQVSPGDARALFWSLHGLERMCRVCARAGSVPPAPPSLVLALPLLGTFSAAIDKLAGCCLLYKKIFSELKKKSTTSRKIEDILWILQAFTVDMIQCLWSENMLTERNAGIVFVKMSPQLVGRLSKNVPYADGALSLRSHAAFAAYTYSYAQMEAADWKSTDNKLWFDDVIGPEFENLGKFLRKALPELRG